MRSASSLAQYSRFKRVTWIQHLLTSRLRLARGAERPSGHFHVGGPGGCRSLELVAVDGEVVDDRHRLHRLLSVDVAASFDLGRERDLVARDRARKVVKGCSLRLDSPRPLEGCHPT